MRRWSWIIGILILIGLAMWSWPFVGAAQLAGAADRGDTEEVSARVNLPALRRSLARQIAGAYLEATGKAEKMGAFGRSVAGAAATTVADPYLAQLLTPENLTSLLGRGKVAAVTVQGRPVSVNQSLPHFPDLVRANAISALTGSYFDGIASFVIPVSAGPNLDETYGIHLRLDGLTWKLAGLDLPKVVLDDMAKAVLAAQPQAAP
jgi:hypothetical protein